MAEIINARMQQKSDSRNNWDASAGFIPKSGEIIVYKEEESNVPARVKVGDGESFVGDLDFITGEVYTTPGEPEGAKDGAVWILEEGLNGVDPYSQPNWNSQEKQNGYIQNRPLWKEVYDGVNLKEINANNPSSELFKIQSLNCRKVSDFYPEFFELDFENFNVDFGDGIIQPVKKYCLLRSEWESDSPREDGIYYVNGSILNELSNWHFFIQTKNQQDTYLACFVGPTNSKESNLEKGAYFFISEDEQPHISSLNFFYKSIKVDNDYEKNLRGPSEARIYRLEDFVILNIQQEEITKIPELIIKELSKFNQGDIILIPEDWAEYIS